MLTNVDPVYTACYTLHGGVPRQGWPHNQATHTPTRLLSSLLRSCPFRTFPVLCRENNRGMRGRRRERGGRKGGREGGCMWPGCKAPSNTSTCNIMTWELLLLPLVSVSGTPFSVLQQGSRMDCSYTEHQVKSCVSQVVMNITLTLELYICMHKWSSYRNCPSESAGALCQLWWFPKWVITTAICTSSWLLLLTCHNNGEVQGFFVDQLKGIQFANISTRCSCHIQS